MQRARIGVIATAVLAVATMAFAQKTDFSGSWTLDPSMSEMGGMGGGGGAPGGAPGGGGMGRGGGMGAMTVKQTPTEIAVTTMGRGGEVTRTYKLDGSETDIQMGQMTAKASAKWNGDKLVITTKTDNGESTQTWSMANGMLTIEQTGGRGPSKRVYKKGT